MKTCKVLAAAFFISMITFTVSAQVKTTAPPKKTVPATSTAPSTNQTNTPVKAAPVEDIAMDPPNPATIRVKIVTDSGTMIVKLYDSTPLHRDNFVKLVKEGFYDSLMFHRVIAGFMIQGGDPQSKNAPSGTMLGNGGSDMQRIPAEFRANIIHKKGALAAARDGNPQKASSACQFYIVQGIPYADAQLNQLELGKGRKYTEQQRYIYKTQGGTPGLDMEYTVFGEVESGMEVIDKIASVPKDGVDRPFGNIRMHMEVIQ